jgi:hypothetical protein
MLTISTQSCSKSTTAAPTLYDTLGGTAKVADPMGGAQIEKGRLAIRGVINSALYVIAGDPAINGYFTVLLGEIHSHPPVSTGFTDLQNNLTDFFCVGAGAQNFHYIGMSMTAAHNPATNARISQKVDSAGFTQFTNDVVTAAVQNQVPGAIIGSLGKVIASQEPFVKQR